MPAPALGATFLVLLLVVLLLALITSWRRSRGLVALTDALRREHQRAALLADVSRLVADSVDMPVAVGAVAELAVPLLADACVTDVAEDDGRLTRFVAAQSAPHIAASLDRGYPATAPVHPLIARVLHEGRPVLERVELDARSRAAAALVIPLLARGRTLGVVSLFCLVPGRGFTPDDRALADDLARRIALAVDNARLYRVADDAHRRFADLVDGLGAIVWEADARRRHYTFVSGRAEAALGYPLARWRDRPDFWLDVQHPDDQAVSAEDSQAAREESRDHDLEYRVITADGRTLWMLDLVRVVRRLDGSVSQLRGVMVDVTHWKQGEVPPRAAPASPGHPAALASVAALANAAAHEINNPLSVIMGNLELFSRRPDTPPMVKVRAAAMLAAGRRIAGIVGSMKQITRLESVPSPGGLPAMLDLKRSSGADDA